MNKPQKPTQQISSETLAAVEFSDVFGDGGTAGGEEIKKPDPVFVNLTTLPREDIILRGPNHVTIDGTGEGPVYRKDEIRAR